MEDDSVANSHPISPNEEEIRTGDEIAELFDTISYLKVKANHQKKFSGENFFFK